MDGQIVDEIIQGKFKETETMDSDNRFSYFFLGLGLGTAVGLLCAPKRGTETRNYLRSKTQEGTRFLKDQSQQVLDNATDAIEHGRRILQDQVKSVSDAVDVGKQAYRDAVAAPPPPLERNPT
jgi:gas vesicle protein